jgi:hypothetical protein
VDRAPRKPPTVNRADTAPEDEESDTGIDRWEGVWHTLNI